MLSALLQLAGAPLVNTLVIVALVCIAIAIFGGARETNAATGGFRTASALTGVLLLFCVYGIYLPHAARSNDAARSNESEAGRPAETRGAPTQKAVASPRQANSGQTQPAAQQPAQSAPMSALPPASTEQPAGPHAKSTNPLPPKDGGNGSPEQQSSQPSTPQAPAQKPFSGRWKNADPKAASILYLKVEEQGGEITVRAWGSCLPQHAGDPVSQYCDWGTGRGLVHEGQATVTWQQGPVLRRMKLEPEGGSLRVVLDSTSRGRPQHIEAHFAKGL